MYYRAIRTCFRNGVTLVELIIAVAMVTIIFAALLPQFVVIRNSWDTKQGTAEAMQNGRVLIEHMNRNLSKAVRINAVSESSDTDGHVEYTDYDGNTFRYDIGAGGYVEFGRVGDLAELAGPAALLQFTCYDVCDLDTPLSPVSDVNLIRTVKADVTIANAAPNGRPRTFTAYAHLRTNGNNQSILSKRSALEYDAFNGVRPALAQIDATHYLCAYTGSSNDGWAVVLTVNVATGAITRGTAYEFDISNGLTPALAKIDATHYLCAYTGNDTDGYAVVLRVNPVTWAVAKGAAFEFDNDNGETPELIQVDDTHYLCAYDGPDDDGWARVLTVNTGTWAVSGAAAFEYNTSRGQFPALAEIDSTHYLCAYTGSNGDGYAVVLTVNTGTWAVSSGASFEFDTSNGEEVALAQVDATHYLAAYDGANDDGWATVLAVNTGTWTVSAPGTAFEFDSSTGQSPALAIIDSGRCLCVYDGPDNDGFAIILDVDSGDWSVSANGAAIEYDTTRGTTPVVAQIDNENYLCAYTGSGTDGFAAILSCGEGLRP